MLIWVINSLMAKSITRSNVLNGKRKTKDLKFGSINISVSYLIPFSKYQNNAKKPKETEILVELNFRPFDLI